MKAHNSTVRLYGAILAILFMSIMGCSKKSDTSTGPSNASGFASVIQDGGGFAPVVPDSTAAVEEPVVDSSGTDVYYCTRKTVSLTAAPDQFATFNPITSIIYPGNLLQGNTLGTASPTAIPLKRGPGTIVMTVVNGASSVQDTMSEVTLGNVYDAANRILARNPGNLAALSTFTRQEISSEEQLGLALNANYKTLASDVKGSFRFDSDVKYNRVLVKLKQQYYTMAFQVPTSYSEFFSPSVTPDDLKRYIYPGNPGSYISSVTYGRIFYLLIQSTESITSIKASIDASFRGAGVSGGVSGSGKYISQLSSLQVGGYAVGGDANKALAALQGDPADLKAYVDSGGTITTGFPISYIVNSLVDPAKVVQMKISTEYDVVDCQPIGQSLDNPIFWYRVDDPKFYTTGSSTGANYITKLKDAFSNTAYDAIPPSKTYGCQLLKNAINGNTMPVMRFVPSGSVDGAFRFPGVPFVNADYTIFAVARLENLAVSYPDYFIWGSGATAGSNLQVGFRDDVRATMAHGGAPLNASAPVDLDKFNIITYRFSQTEGMSIYFNNLLVASGEDASKSGALTSFLEARFGTESGNPIQVAEIRAFGIAASDAQRGAIVTELLTKYAL